MGNLSCDVNIGGDLIERIYREIVLHFASLGSHGDQEE